MISFENNFFANAIFVQPENKILEEMTDDVAELVLADNRLQTQAISIASYQGSSVLADYSQFLERLEKFLFEFNGKDDELLFKLKLKMFESSRLKSCNDAEKKSKIRTATTPVQLIKEFENI
jgi:hypothetical protein